MVGEPVRMTIWGLDNNAAICSVVPILQLIDSTSTTFCDLRIGGSSPAG